MKSIEDSLRDLWDNIKCTNIRIIGVPEEEEKKKGTKKIFEEIIVENRTCIYAVHKRPTSDLGTHTD